MKYIVIDMQFGSTGKGQVVGSLIHSSVPVSAVASAFAPNAGHTFNHQGRKFVHTMLPIGSIAPSVDAILIGPGSVLNVPALASEITQARDLLQGKNLFIHPNASVLLPHHTEEERKYVKIGSTMKGSAAAVKQKMDRDPDHNNTASKMRGAIIDVLNIASNFGMNIVIDHDLYMAASKVHHMIVEGAQGASLSIHSRFYPYCTSRDVSVNQLLADCHLPYTHDDTVIGVCRTYPIRVANRFDENGRMIGTSGGYYDDQVELDWKIDLGREPELTTVTKLPRRVFSLSRKQLAESALYNNPTIMALTFCDYLTPAKPVLNEAIDPAVLDVIRLVEDATKRPVRIVSFGPDSTDVYSLEPDTYIIKPLKDLDFIPF